MIPLGLLYMVPLLVAVTGSDFQLCEDQVECISFSKRLVASPDCAGSCEQYEICLHMDMDPLKGCTKTGSISHSCVMNPLTCSTGDNFDIPADTVIWNGTEYQIGEVTSSDVLAKGGVQCQTAAAGSNVYFMLKDGPNCIGDIAWMELGWSLPDGQKARAFCGPRQASTKRCNGNDKPENVGKECVWQVQVPGECTGCTTWDEYGPCEPTSTPNVCQKIRHCNDTGKEGMIDTPLLCACPTTSSAAVSITKMTGDGEVKGDGLHILAGSTVTWTYIIANTADASCDDCDLRNLVVVDDKETLPVGDSHHASLAPGAVWSFQWDGIAVAGEYTNQAIVNASDAQGNPKSDTDTSGYFGADPHLHLTKSTNGNCFLEGSPVEWTYNLSNTGNVPVSSISIVDNNGGATPFTVLWDETLAVGANASYVAYGFAVKGHYTNVAVANGTYSDSLGHIAHPDDTATSGYTGQEMATVTLMAGQSTPVGNVQAYFNGEYVHVVFNTLGGWTLWEVHVFVGTTIPSDILTPSGNPAPGRFTKQQRLDGVTYVDVTDLLSAFGISACTGETMHLNISAHAVVRKVTATSYDEQTAWGQGQNFEGANWGMFFPLEIACDCMVGCTSAESSGQPYWGDWEDENTCSQPCGGGVIARHVLPTVLNPCPPYTEYQLCNTGTCGTCFPQPIVTSFPSSVSTAELKVVWDGTKVHFSVAKVTNKYLITSFSIIIAGVGDYQNFMAPASRASIDVLGREAMPSCMTLGAQGLATLSIEAQVALSRSTRPTVSLTLTIPDQQFSCWCGAGLYSINRREDDGGMGMGSDGNTMQPVQAAVPAWAWAVVAVTGIAALGVALGRLIHRSPGTIPFSESKLSKAVVVSMPCQIPASFSPRYASIDINATATC